MSLLRKSVMLIVLIVLIVFFSIAGKNFANV